MYGWRARLGIIIPSVNTVMEPEFNKMAPEGVSVHAARMMALGKFEPKSLVEMAEETENAAKRLKQIADVIGWGCTSGSFVKGKGYDLEIIDRIKKVTGLPATTTSTAVIHALKTLKVKKIAVATPYTEEVNDLLKKFLEDNGFIVTNIKGLGVEVRGGQGVYHPSTTYRLSREVDSDEAECIFISCTNFRSIEIIDQLEKDCQKPVISSNTATMWHMLKLAGINENIKGFGTLLEKY